MPPPEAWSVTDHGNFLNHVAAHYSVPHISTSAWPNTGMGPSRSPPANARNRSAWRPDERHAARETVLVVLLDNRTQEPRELWEAACA